jgi:DNA-binding transcriptional MerR regulator
MPQAMDHQLDALELLELQGSTDLITKAELKQYVRRQGGQISDRNIAYYSSIGLIPPAVRIGARGGAYPRIVGELLSWVVRSRDGGLSIEAIKELIPLWRLLIHGRKSGCVDLAELEYVARSNVTLAEANRAVPLLISHLINAVCDDCRSKISWLLKDGSTFTSADSDALTLSFVLAELDPDTGDGRQVLWTQLKLPGIGGPDTEDPTTIVLGIPNGVWLRPHEQASVHSPGLGSDLVAAVQTEEVR